jgi:dihydroneopterin aldolase
MPCGEPDVDRIAVPEIRLLARVGVTDAERASPQEILVHVELSLDLSRAGATDDLAATVDYVAVCELLDRVARARPFRLLEAIAEESARAVLSSFPVAEVRIGVRKPGALKAWGAPYAAVEVHRRRQDG